MAALDLVEMALVAEAQMGLVERKAPGAVLATMGKAVEAVGAKALTGSLGSAQGLPAPRSPCLACTPHP